MRLQNVSNTSITYLTDLEIKDYYNNKYKLTKYKNGEHIEYYYDSCGYVQFEKYKGSRDSKGQFKTVSTYFNNMKNGEERTYYHFGALESKCTYVYDKKEGEYIKYNSNDTIDYTITYKNGKKHGEQKKYFYNMYGQFKEIKIMCTYVDDKIEGEYKQYYQDGKISYTCIYINGKKFGQYVKYYENGQIKENGMYINDKKEGEIKSYYEDGVLKSISLYIDNKMNGEYIEYYHKKKMYFEDDDEYNINKNQLNIDSNGIPYNICIYIEDNKIQETYFYRDGKVKIPKLGELPFLLH